MELVVAIGPVILSYRSIHEFLELFPDGLANPIHQGVPHMLVDLLEAHQVADGCFPRQRNRHDQPWKDEPHLLSFVFREL